MPGEPLLWFRRYWLDFDGIITHGRACTSACYSFGEAIGYINLVPDLRRLEPRRQVRSGSLGAVGAELHQLPLVGCELAKQHDGIEARHGSYG